MAITYLTVVSTPSDGSAAAQAGPSVTIVPSGAFNTAGDLIVVCCQYRGSVTITNSTSGGQTWNAETAVTDGATATITTRIFWCVFNGTWSANPVFTNTSGTLAHTVVMQGWRPTNTGSTWAVDNALSGTTFTAATTVTRTGVTTSKSSTVTIAIMATADDNTWGNTTGAGWLNGDAAQFRNTTGNDQSQTWAYLIQTAPGATGNVSKDQLTLGADAGVHMIMSFAETPPPLDDYGASGFFGVSC